MADHEAMMVPQFMAAAGEQTGGGPIPSKPRPARLHENRLLASLPQHDIALLAPQLQVTSVGPGAVLQLQGHPIEYVYFPHEGLVSLHAMTIEGDMIQVASVGRAGAVCPVLKFDVREGFLTAVALSTMRVSRIEVGKINVAQRESKTINRALRACRPAPLLQLRQNIVCGGIHSAEQRMSRWILEAADRLESDVLPIPVTQAHVAQCLAARHGRMRWGLRMIRLRLEGMRYVIEPLDPPASQWLDRYSDDHWLWYRGGTRYEIDPRFLNSFLAAAESAAVRVESWRA